MVIHFLDKNLTNQNPWWNEGGLKQDPDLSRVYQSPLTYRPEPISIEDCVANAVLTLRGPRRSGKTVALKLLVARLIEEEGWAPRSILWLTAETIRTMAQLEEILDEVMTKFPPKLLCIDEITAVVGWQRVIKKLRDTGVLGKCSVLLTGSSAYDLKSGAERMAGRRGPVASPDRVLLPMDFAAFVAQVRRVVPTRIDADLQRDFLICGGFPFRVEEMLACLRDGRAFDPLSLFQVFDDVVFYEFGRRRLDRNIALEVITRLGTIGIGAISYEGFAKPLTAAKDTVRKYLDALGDAFLLATISSYDTGRGRVAPKKDRKFVWVDPALGLLPTWIAQGSALDEAGRAEGCVGIELLRRHEIRLWEGLAAPRNVFTWKSTSGKEVDFLVVDPSRKLALPIEVKYQESVSDWDFQVVERAFGSGIIVTKSETRARPKARAVSLGEFLKSKLTGYEKA